ncbi:MAG TPA: hypothetical protein VNG13_03415 [Mycobacteriales bacterium]|nr:hypothetical protein [Mycobacteriales bacterium]
MNRLRRSPLNFGMAAALGVLLLSAGCAVPRGGPVHRAVDICVPVVPLTTDAVHDRGHVIYIRQIDRTQLIADFPALKNHARRTPRAAAAPTICLVVYLGPYAAGQVSGASGSGRYALFAISTRRSRVFAVEVTDHLPRGIRAK